VEFAINNSFVANIGTTPFYLNHGRHPHTPLTVSLAEAVVHARGSRADVPAAKSMAERIQDDVLRARRLLAAANDRMRARVNANKAERSYEVGQQVWLSTKNLKFKSAATRKFIRRWIGPMQVTRKVGPVAYQLKLLPGMERLHDVFHCSLLKPYRGDTTRPPPVISLEGGEEYEVQRILNHQYSGRTAKFLIKWADDSMPDEWCDEKDLNCPELLREYWSYVGRADLAKKVKLQRKR